MRALGETIPRGFWMKTFERKKLGICLVSALSVPTTALGIGILKVSKIDPFSTFVKHGRTIVTQLLEVENPGNYQHMGRISQADEVVSQGLFTGRKIPPKTETKNAKHIKRCKGRCHETMGQTRGLNQLAER